MKKVIDWLEAQKKLLAAATPITTKEILWDLNNLPVDVCDFEWVPASVRTEHERALKIIEKMRGALEKAQSNLVNEYGYTIYETNFDCINSALAYFPEDGEK